MWVKANSLVNATVDKAWWRAYTPPTTEDQPSSFKVESVRSKQCGGDNYLSTERTLMIKLGKAPYLLLTAAFVAACGSSSSTSSGSSSGGGAAAQTVNIGLLANLTGTAAASYGVPFTNGLKLALQDINSAGALKSANVTLNMDTRDTASTEANAVTLFNQFAQAKDQIAISDSQSPIALAIDPLANNQKVLFLTGGGTKLPNSAGYSFTLADLGTPMTTLGSSMEKSGLKRVATIIAGDNPSFATLASAAEKAYKSAGGSGFVASQTIQSSDTDFSSVLTNLRQSNPDGILISALPAQSGNIIRQIKSGGGLDSAKLFGTIAWGPQVYDVAKTAAVGAEYAAVWAPGAANSGTFESEYKSAYNSAPVAYSALGYEVGWLIAAAAQTASSNGATVTSTSLRDAMPSAASSSIVQQHGPISNFAFSSGHAQYPGLLAVFASDGSIKAAS